MMKAIEINMVVSDSLKALELYEKIFEDIERVEVTNLNRGENEAIFNLYGIRIHMLDENPQFQLKAPDPEHPNTMWFNVVVPDIKNTYDKAIAAGCKEIQPVTEMKEYGISNAIFIDPFGYQWLLHQIHQEMSFEERMQVWEENKENE